MAGTATPYSEDTYCSVMAGTATPYSEDTYCSVMAGIPTATPYSEVTYCSVMAGIPTATPYSEVTYCSVMAGIPTATPYSEDSGPLGSFQLRHAHYTCMVNETTPAHVNITLEFIIYTPHYIQYIAVIILNIGSL